jgi:hypothetical protein
MNLAKRIKDIERQWERGISWQTKLKGTDWKSRQGKTNPEKHAIVLIFETAPTRLTACGSEAFDRFPKIREH